MEDLSRNTDELKRVTEAKKREVQEQHAKELAALERSFKDKLDSEAETIRARLAREQQDLEQKERYFVLCGLF